MVSPDTRIARIAARQHGVFTWDQALASGFNPGVIEYRLRTGRWRRVYLGVYVLAGAPDSFEQRSMAAVLAGGTDAVASHLTAGGLHRLEGIGRAHVEILIPRRRRVRLSGVRVRQSDLLRGDRALVDSVPVTAPTRTMIDLASLLDEDALEDALHDAVRRKLVHPRKLEARLESMERRGRNGTGLLLGLVRGLTPGNVSGSRWENKVRRLLVRSGLPEPVRQYVITDEGGVFVARPDLAYPENRLYIEYDGKQHEKPRQRSRDLDRLNRLSGVGWRPLIITDADFKKPPAAIVAKVVNARRF